VTAARAKIRILSFTKQPPSCVAGGFEALGADVREECKRLAKPHRSMCRLIATRWREGDYKLS
jgi:hypothetical protein